MKKRILMLLLSFILIFTGCVSDKKENNTAAGNEDNAPKEGGVLNISSYSPDTMNPLMTQYSCVRDFLYLIYEGLFIVNEDLSARPVLASDYTVSEGNTVYTINLAENVTFHDGSAFDSSDVISTFEYIQNFDSIYTDSLSNVASYSAKGSKTVVITLKSPQANFVNNLDFPILPSGLSKAAFSVPNTSFTPIGTGRYVYANTIPYEGAELASNEKWKGSSKVYIPKVNIRFVRDNDGMLYAFDSGETDIITTERGRWGEFSYTGNYRTGEITTSKYTYIGINTRNSALADLDVRKAISDVIDKELLSDVLLFSHACVANSPISSKAFFAGNGSEKEKNKDEIKAQINFLKEKKLTLYLLYNDESEQKKNIAEYVKEKLKEAGIRVLLSHVGFEAYSERIQQGDYQMYIGEIDMSSDANVRFMFDTAPEKIIPEEAADNGETVLPIDELSDTQNSGTGTFCDFSSTELDSLIYSMNTAATENDASVAYKNFEEYFKTNVIQIPLFHINDAIFVNNRIKGKIKTNLTNFYADFGELYIDYDE